jgi:hypothetical protein
VEAWDSRIATKASPGAKIFPFRSIVNGMILDRRGFGYDPNFSTNFTMLAALDAMAGPLMQMGFMRPSGLTPQERAVMAQYPNLLNFDEETYFHSGDIRQSVNIGLGKLGLMMAGQDPGAVPPEMLGAIGSNFWSGDVLGLDLPNNPMDPLFNPTAPPTEVTGSFISLSHAIKRHGALTCNDCHSPSGVMDFKALCYPSEEAAHLQTLLQAVQAFTYEQTVAGLKLRWAAIPGRTYQLLGTADLKAGPWVPVGTSLTASNRWMESVLAPGQLGPGPQKFLRIMETTP